LKEADLDPGSLISSPVIRGRVGRGQASPMISDNFRSEISKNLY
jgi:hypothetical protein